MAASAVGDISFQHGGNIPLHESHERGLDVDVRPIRDNEQPVHVGHELARFASTIGRRPASSSRPSGPPPRGHVKLIYFNDPVLIREGLTDHFPGHDDHLHVRYCGGELVPPVAQYPCNEAADARAAPTRAPAGTGSMCQLDAGSSAARALVRLRTGRNELGPRRRAGHPVGVRTGARGARYRHAQGALRPVHRRTRGPGERWLKATFETIDPATEQPLAPSARAGDPVDIGQGGQCRALCQRRSWGRSPGKRERAGVPVPYRASSRSAEGVSRSSGSMDSGKPIKESRDGRRPARGARIPVLRGLGGQARLRVPGVGGRCRSASRRRSSPGTSRS